MGDMLGLYFETYLRYAGDGRHWMHVEDAYVLLCTERGPRTYKLKQFLTALQTYADVREYALQAATRMNEHMK